MAKCTLCVDRVTVGLEPACIKACPTGCLQFGTKEDMLASAPTRVRSSSTRTASRTRGVYDPPGVGGTGVVNVLPHGDHPGALRPPAEEPQDRPADPVLEGAAQVDGRLAFGASLAAAASTTWGGPARGEASRSDAEHPPKTEREIVRYTLFERLLHWTVAFTFLYLGLTGLGLFTPKLDWLLNVFGGGQVVRAWHPIVGASSSARCCSSSSSGTRTCASRPTTGSG